MATIYDIYNYGVVKPVQAYYAINRTVAPNSTKNDPLDVMLIQFLIGKFFAAVPGNEQIAFIDIYNSAKIRKKRFDDGIYGENTLKAVNLFESASYTVKNGIIPYKPVTGFGGNYVALIDKMDKLNWVFDALFSSSEADKWDNVARVANPRLVSKLRHSVRG